VETGDGTLTGGRGGGPEAGEVEAEHFRSYRKVTQVTPRGHKGLVTSLLKKVLTQVKSNPRTVNYYRWR